jgi:hypothetical protein
MKTISIFLFALFLLSLSCKKKNTEMIPDIKVVIYKFKGDYINKVCVLMSNDKSQIKAFPSPNDPSGDTTKRFVVLKNGYYTESGIYSWGINSAYLNINRVDYRHFLSTNKINDDTLKNHILDTDPYLEYYTCSNDTFAKDTSLIKHIDDYISNNELVSKLKFIKIK